MSVNNGERLSLYIDKVHDGLAGVVSVNENERIAFNGKHAIAFSGNLAKMKPRAGMRANLDGLEYRIAYVEPSQITGGLYRAVLSEQ